MRHSLIVTFTLGLSCIPLMACDSTKSQQQEKVTLSVWRSFDNANGTTTTIPQQPQRILSTSVTTTGMLLAIGAPVVASVTAVNGEFFDQWADVAKQKNVSKAWAAGRVDLETALALQPDLIVVSTSGADSALEQLSEFQQIAPTIVVDYASQTWQQLAAQLGQATGLEIQATQRIQQFNQQLQHARETIHPSQRYVNIISYNGSGNNNPIATATGVHGQLFTALGFEVEVPDMAWHAGAGDANDFVWAQYEHLTQLKAPVTFLIRADQKQVDAFLNDPLLQNLPSVKSRQVYALGQNSFRIDYYSALQVIDTLLTIFPKKTVYS